jgi:hypothetical protein
MIWDSLGIPVVNDREADPPEAGRVQPDVREAEEGEKRQKVRSTASLTKSL